MKTCALLELMLQQADAVRLQKRLCKHFDSIWHYLGRADVPFTNNASERVLHPVVIHRRVIGGFRPQDYARAYTLYRTVEATVLKHEQ